MLIKELEAALFERFPRENAEDWDHVGLSVGRPDEEVQAVACALDATEANIRAAHDRGANVLLTHHPIYIKAPDAFVPASAQAPQASSALYTAASLGVSVISNHTNLDRSHEAREVILDMFDCRPVSSLENPADSNAVGYGAVAEVQSTNLRDFAALCAEAFGTEPRVWGSPNAPVRRFGFLGGSGGDFGDAAINAGCDVLVTGEAGYHVAQDLAIRGLGVILLGHDRSEEPFVDILARAAVCAGVPKASVHTIDAPRLWWTLTLGDSTCPSQTRF